MPNNGRNSGSIGNKSNGNGRKDSESAELSSRAYELWVELEDKIERLIDKIISFNSVYSGEDYKQEAFIACVTAIRKYEYVRRNNIEDSMSREFIELTRNLKEHRRASFISESVNLNETKGNKNALTSEGVYNSVCRNKPIMKLDVFAYWYIQKRLYKMADRDEVIFYVYNRHGEFERTMRNAEYRKSKKELTENGCTVRSANIFKQLDYFTEEDEDYGNRMDFVDRNFMGFSQEIKEILEEDVVKFNTRFNG
jgi:hypothetical protein